ncbi:siderophore-interacting protein [Curtobacterium sp. MCJR17_055]|uniref:siderophore-interacting protein n=1 Tax=unclassified Curtobacterium TaxID=257496 RepID=UPI000D85B25B|nr:MULTISPECIES: siderophore-interacting protein [unclassified Curtobacterium]PYY35235.1 siderophore-interacting protein [Curtobacterium sp. MCBD17_029]PYY45551.1 siderophore-interacting protein [Curtobacterium sp. MCBD17_023]PYY55482.1 siderophore-interacting protein [Curtobacterium sp. MCJR17_055]PYY60230.1 siderophore-interacting protein [Curtobacterium sp. MCPF17_015]PZE91940.1 siderophore-interacting protein [Curtobacterium sp. MCBD17_008]
MAARYRVFSVRVAAVTSLTPHFVRVTLTGAELAEFSAVGLDQRIKVLLPLDGHGFSDLPEGEDWFAAWRALPDATRNPIRTYTVRSFRPDAHELDIDFVAHGDGGPASRWVSACRVGDELRIVGPRVPESPEDLPSGAAEFAPGSANRILLAGDETAAPAICAILEALDVSAVGHVFIEVPTDADRLPVSAPAGVEVRWIARNGASHGVRMTDHVQAWASTVAVPAPVLTDGRAAVPVELADVDVDHQVLWDVPREDDDLPVYAWIAGEAGCVKELRRHLVRGVGLDRKQVAFMGYWRHGKAEC